MYLGTVQAPTVNPPTQPTQPTQAVASSALYIAYEKYQSNCQVDLNLFTVMCDEADSPILL